MQSFLESLHRRQVMISTEIHTIMSGKKEKVAWRTQGDPSLPGIRRSEPAAKTTAPHDPTYGGEPDLLDHPGTIVEPDVRKKISKYFRSMKLREWIREVLMEEN